MKKLKVGVIGGTGYVGQRFVTLLHEHPWFEVVLIAASSRSAGKTYADAVEGRWKLEVPMPISVQDFIVEDADNVETIADVVDFVFCAVDMSKDAIRDLEERYARAEIPVVSNNSAHRWTEDVPVIIPEINDAHTDLIPIQRKRLGTKNGFIACKPNCSIQSYVPALTPLLDFGVEKIVVSTYQAISGAGKTFTDWPQMQNNLIPFISGEEDKSQREPLKVWAQFENDGLTLSDQLISAQCYRVSVQEGHTAAVYVQFKNKPSEAEIIKRWNTFEGYAQKHQLPSAPKPFLNYMDDEQRPQPLLDKDAGKGMAISIGRLQKDPIFDYKFVSFSHNTIRGAAGGAVLMAELLVDKGYIREK